MLLLFTVDQTPIVHVQLPAEIMSVVQPALAIIIRGCASKRGDPCLRLTPSPTPLPPPIKGGGDFFKFPLFKNYGFRRGC